MSEKIKELRAGHEVLVGTKESNAFVEKCKYEYGITPHCTGAVNIMGTILISFVA